MQKKLSIVFLVITRESALTTKSYFTLVAAVVEDVHCVYGRLSLLLVTEDEIDPLVEVSRNVLWLLPTEWNNLECMEEEVQYMPRS